MQPKAYMTFSVLGSAAPVNGGGSLTLPAMNRLMHVLHGAFSTLPGSYAIQLPEAREGEFKHPGRKIRVFSESLEALDDLHLAVGQHHVMGYFMVTRPTGVPTEFAGPWTETKRFQIPSRKSSMTARTEVNKGLRTARLREADNLPYFRLSSKSSGHAVTLHIKTIRHETATGTEGTPNKYGLSVTTRPVLLPFIEE